jgi:hypothetical protein
MGKRLIIIGLILAIYSFQPVFGKDLLASAFKLDINHDGKIEHLIHHSYGGTGNYGRLKIYNDKGRVIFSEKTQGDPYLWDSQKMRSGLNPLFFPDINRDGIVEILIGHPESKEDVAAVDQKWNFDIFQWDGHQYSKQLKTVALGSAR